MRLILQILFPAGLAAALIPTYSLETLVARSPRILEGKVIDIWSAWDPPHKHIWTHYRVETTEAFRGQATEALVSEPGGRVGGVEQTVSGSVPYARGERVILFLFRTPIGYWRTTGGPQGRLVIGGRDDIRLGNGAHPAAASPFSLDGPVPGPIFRAWLRRLAASTPVREAGRQ